MAIPDISLELSIEQLFSALNKKLTIECTRLQPARPPVPRALVATLAAEVDALEKQAREILRGVISLRNPLRPVNRLPPEVIALCAAFVSDTDPKPTIILTHVCQYWREAITSSPGNWASIGSGWKRLVPLCLERAGATPLTANISVLDVEEDKDLIQTLAPHISRISHLSLTGYAFIEDVAGRLPGFFASPMLNLTSLELEQVRRPAESFPSNEDPTPPLLQNVSKLKFLHLTQVPLYPTLSTVTSLVELKLIDYTIPFGKFLGLLESNITLEVVVLALGFTRTSVLAALERRVSLARLRHLTLTCDNAIDARGLLSCLSFPRSVNIEVRASPRNACDNLASFLPHPPTSIQDLLAPITTIKDWHSLGKFYLSSNDGSFTFHYSGPPKKLYQEFNLFAAGAVREFHLSAGYQSSTVHLSWPLERLPALEALVISGTPLHYGLLSDLTKEPVLCPSLKTIALFDCEVTRNVIEELKQIVAKREHSTAARLHRVVIVSDTDLPAAGLIRWLRRSVPQVDVMLGGELPDLL